MTKKNKSYTIRLLKIFFIIIISIISIKYFVVRLNSELHFFRAEALISKKKFELARGHLEKALDDQPRNYRLLRTAGNLYYQWAQQKKNYAQVLKTVEKSYQYFRKALEANPLDAFICFELAMSADWLEKLQLYSAKPSSKLVPLKYYRQAVRLRPNAAYCHYGLLNYLFREGSQKEIFAEIETLAGFYPQAFQILQRKKIWKPEYSAAFARGLQKAIQNKLFLREAYLTLTEIEISFQDYKKALKHFQAGLQFKAYYNKSRDYIKLGDLYLKNKQFASAEYAFLQALSLTETPDRDLRSIYGLYSRLKKLKELGCFLEQIDPFQVESIYFMQVRLFMDLEQYQKAIEILEQINQKKKNSRAFVMLARIAEKQKDPFKMELFANKTVLLEPENHEYHFFNAQILYKLKKYRLAEEAAFSTIQFHPEPSHGLYSFRGRLRYLLKDYAEAVEDWEMAIKLKPHAYYYVMLGDSHSKMGHWSVAMGAYQKAMRLDPENKTYAQKYEQAKGSYNK